MRSPRDFDRDGYGSRTGCSADQDVVARHRAWTGVVLFMLMLPLWMAFGYQVPLRMLSPIPQHGELTGSVPAATVPVVITQMNDHSSAISKGDATPQVMDWREFMLGIYVLGVCVLLLRLAMGTCGAYRLMHQARCVQGHLTSSSCLSPITVGWLHAVTILPDGWGEWAQAKLETVLAHENEHVRRHDPLFQWLALLNRAVFWFHPLAWWLERKLAALSEEACDMAVLERGHDPRDYSEYLLDLARSVTAHANVSGFWVWRCPAVSSRSASRKSCRAFGRQGFPACVWPSLSWSAQLCPLF